MSKLFCKPQDCVACNACVNACPKQAISVIKGILTNAAFIDEDKCIKCGLCDKVCQAKNELEFNTPIKWLEGWSKDLELRNHSSSGGLARNIMLNCLSVGYKIFSCVTSKDEFFYKELTSKEEILSIRGSYYVKSDTKDVYKKIREYLLKKESVLFIGLPCHVSGLKLFLQNIDTSNLYLVDIICHGTPSLEEFQLFSRENNIDDYQEISFRQKHISTSVPQPFDYWTVPFIDGVTYTENCYNCKYARAERISDITLGDSWGTKRNSEDKNNGISLVIVNTDQGNKLLEGIDAELFDVDKDASIAAQGQLRRPAPKSKRRDKYVEVLTKTNKYNLAVKKAYGMKLKVSNLKKSKLVFKLYSKIKPPKSKECIVFAVKKIDK